MKKLLLLFLLAIPAGAQNMRYDSVALGPKGPIAGASIAVCTQPANTASQPCSPLASLCSSLTDATCTSQNPVTADFLGNYHFYAKMTQGPYTVQVYGPGVAVPLVLTDQNLNGTLNGLSATNATLITPTIVTPVVQDAGALARMGLTLKSGSNGGNYSSSSTTLVNVDGTNLSNTVTIPLGWKLSVIATGTCFISAGTSTNVTIALADGGTPTGQRLLVTPITPAVTNHPFTVAAVITGDGASHTVTLQYATQLAGSPVAIQNSGGAIPEMIFTLMPSN